MKKEWTVVKVLRAARAKLVKGWTKNMDAVDRHGTEVDPRGVTAVRWCASGAVRATGAPKRLREQARKYLSGVLKTPEEYWDFNDRQKRKAPVLAMFDRAIRAAKRA